MKNMDEIISSLVEFNKQNKAVLQLKNEQCADLQSKLEDALKNVANLENDMQEIVYEKKNIELELAKARQTIEFLQEEKQSFLKVSHIVALEKENAKLKAELENTKKTKNVEPFLYEKKIKGIVYLIDDKMNIHTKEPDGARGQCVGRLEKVGDKTKAVWN